MLNFEDTAYPRFKKSYSESELQKLFYPSEEEIEFCKNNSTGEKPLLCMLLLLKSFQNIGYFIQLNEIPENIIKFIVEKSNFKGTINELIHGYQDSGSKRRHVKCIREYLNTKQFNNGGNDLLEKVLPEMALIKHELIDLININLEYLVKERFEIPAFRTIHDICKYHRAKVNHKIYRDIFEKLDESGRYYLGNLFLERNQEYSLWDDLKKDLEKPSFKVMADMLMRQKLLQTMSGYNNLIQYLPPIKIQTFYEEANGYDIGSLFKVKEDKRLTLILCFLYTKSARINDDLCNVFIKRIKKFNVRAKFELQLYLDKNSEKTESVFKAFNEIEDQVKSGIQELEKINEITNIVNTNQELFDYARTQVESGIKNFNRFVWNHYKQSRKRLLKILTVLNLSSTSEDSSIINAIEYMLFHKDTTTEWLYPGRIYKRKGKTGPILIDFSWIPDNWWKLVTGKKKRDSFPQKINRKHFEACLCNQIALELQAGDLCINNSIDFSDYRKELISEEESLRTLDEYGKLVGISTNKKQFIMDIQNNLEKSANFTDETFQ
ncbi:DUF4158 domain-containing protein [Fluviispira sanaruensis]|uniref:DUF4158 domain-containing protein n=1 Tax=Fluviispira sanaruensis TaxID=2493639 RepID=A0A4V0P2G0_FLUSA|nr:DUF4158 domain-containing protein [Fluviispira sanaruensis]BBH53097.1 hypothetical protein JCM31447_15400 [Fluviispira sanaruensis]